MTPADGPSPMALYVYAGLTLVLVFVWLAEVAYFAIRYGDATKTGEKAPGSTLALWVASLAFVFTGPCMVVLAIGSLIGGLVHLKRSGNEPTRVAALATVVTSATLLGFALIGGIILGLGGYFG
jgi:hypothetical protein